MSVFARIGMGVLVLACFGLGIWMASQPSVDRVNQSIPADRGQIFSYTFASDVVFERANEAAASIERTGVRSAIVAHHLLVGDKIAQQVAMLGTGREETVVVLSPNHFSQGRSALQTTTGTWRTSYGDLDVDESAVESLRERVPSLSLEPETFKTEHGVSALAPFVKKWFAQAKIVPLVIHDKATQEEVAALAVALEEIVPDAIIIASIDMSHNLPLHIQSYHDEVTARSIARGVSDFDLEIDANDVLRTLLEINRLRGTQQWIQTYHGSSFEMAATNDWRENPSHILGHFLKGAPVLEPFVSLHFVGDVMLDRGVREKIDEFGVEYPWEEVSRYLLGSQYRIANLEGTISEKASLYTHEPPFIFTFATEFVEAIRPFIDVVSLANNHADDYGASGEQETRARLDALGIEWFGGATASDRVYRIDKEGMAISLIGYHQFGASLEELEEVIAQEALADRFVIVLPHWGEEYITSPQNGQRAKAKRMIAAGANLIIGSHPHVVQGIEIIDNVPVIYSLGNFVFDQEFGETVKGLTAGVILEPGRATLYLSPVSTRGAQPEPLSDEETSELFSSRAISDTIITIFYDEPSSRP